MDSLRSYIKLQEYWIEIIMIILLIHMSAYETGDYTCETQAEQYIMKGAEYVQGSFYSVKNCQGT